MSSLYKDSASTIYVRLRIEIWNVIPKATLRLMRGDFNKFSTFFLKLFSVFPSISDKGKRLEWIITANLARNPL